LRNVEGVKLLEGVPEKVVVSGGWAEEEVMPGPDYRGNSG